jgi:very-short-patch-repair endonuclease
VFEIEFPAFCTRWDLPEPQMNVRVAGYTVDAYFPEQKVIVELDSRAYHLNPVSFETDRDRDADTLKSGIVTVRITEHRMTRTPRHEAERLKVILDARKPS